MDLDQEEEAKNIFKGTSLKIMSTENELKVWNKVISLCDNSLSKYDTDLETDNGLLEMDDNEHNLSNN